MQDIKINVWLNGYHHIYNINLMKNVLNLLLTVIALTACTQEGADAPRSDTTPPNHFNINIETMATGLEYPWGIVFLPDGSALVTEKAGRLRLLKDGKLSTPISGVPLVLYKGQAGLFDVAMHPDYATNQFVYLSFAKGTEKDNATTLIRAKFDGKTLSEVTQIFESNPHKKGTNHFGARILFLSDKTLLLSLGEGFSYKDEAQNLMSDFGKIMHLRDDGVPVDDHQFSTSNDQNVKSHKGIFSYGHRNPQGLAFDKATNTIYENEHGPRGGDEINVLVTGKNYGWPKITYGVDYTGLPISDKVAMDGMEQPLLYWVPSIAPSGMTFYDKDLFADWKGDLLVSALAGEQLRRVELKAGKVLKQETFLTELKTRFRNITTAPDGSIWVLTDEPKGKVLKLTPKR
jgi:glucose/arabinose dehydrogenase